MGYFILGIAVLGLLLVFALQFSRMQPGAAKTLILWSAALGGAIITVVLFLAGRVGLAIGLAVGLGGILIRLFREQAMNGAQEKSKTSGSSPPGRSSLIQSRAQALEVLGLSNDATDADIEAAYKRLIQKLHPDHGGTEFLTKQLNAARDFLSNH